MPLAPGRFSTTKRWPNVSPSFTATTRATVSVPPPAGKGTIMRTGGSGQVSAEADAVPSASDTASETQTTMAPSMDYSPGARDVSSFFNMPRIAMRRFVIRALPRSSYAIIILYSLPFRHTAQAATVRTAGCERDATAEPRHHHVGPAHAQPDGLLRP